jgi:hypothetical protein
MESWSESSQLSAAMLIEEYGPPDRVEDYRLDWNDKGFCKRLTAWNVKPSAGTDAEPIECAVDYPVTLERRGDLAEFSSHLRVSVNGTELSARSDSEDINHLTLNLATLVIGGLDPSVARVSYANTLHLQDAGKVSALTAKVLFQPTLESRSFWPIRLSLAPGMLTHNPLWKNEPSSP